MMKKNLLFSILCSFLLMAMQPVMAQEDALELEEVEEQQVEPAIPESELQEAKPSAMLSWWRSLRKPTLQDLQNARSYVNSKYRCMWYGEGCSRKERAVLGTLAAAAGVAVGTATAVVVKRRREKRAEREADEQAKRERVKRAAPTLQSTLEEMAHQAEIAYQNKRFWFDSAKKGNVKGIRKMMERYDVNTMDNQGWNALMTAAEKGHIEVVRELLKDREIKINQRNLKGETALMWAVIPGHTEIVKELIGAGAEVNIRNYEGKTALMYAAVFGHTEIVEMLLAALGIEVNIRDKKGKTALIHAAAFGHPNIVRQLKRVGGIEVNTQDKEGFTALMWAVAMGHPEDEETVKILLGAQGINVNIGDNKGDTALMWAVGRVKPEMVALLLGAQGIDVSIRNTQGYTAWDYIWSSAHPDISDIIESFRVFFRRMNQPSPSTDSGAIFTRNAPAA